MTTTAHLSLLQLVAATQQALATVPAARVYVERTSAIDRDECPAINIAPGAARFEAIGSENGMHDLLKATLAFSLKVHTRGDPHTQTADPIISEAHTALMADPSLGGHALRLRLLSSLPQLGLADGAAGLYELGYEATVVVNERDLALQAV